MSLFYWHKTQLGNVISSIHVLLLFQSRRKTALPEELLHPKDKKAKTPTEPTVPLILDNDGFAIPNSFPRTNNNTNDTNAANSTAQTQNKDTGEDKSLRLADKFQIDEKTMQKLIDLEKTLKDRKTGGPGCSSLSVRDKDADSVESRARSGSFSTDDQNPNDHVNQTIAAPGSFQRNTRMTKSARPFGKSASGGSLRGGMTASLRKQNSSATSSKNSPLMEQKSAGEPT